ncbi:glycerophosphodiester phosphodiesterase family protein [Simiduia curdlanivorans]|uniref:Glycerophosphodiester phosphodiesterase n=1 Tax=Simiduia curdlanivorans TaxID=1492769 RepID=A0ABV8UZ09_9GAMM|nr:glycerophosphodiester phosphodiesterase family protein [Simiduia curdlanivorans]MDN3639152.1 glycerophosphodiester phosphodiesterase family protein [Simiduia curdlanivorans]
MNANLTQIVRGKTAVLLVAAALVQGCSTAPKKDVDTHVTPPELSHLPATQMPIEKLALGTEKHHELVDIQRSLADRNLFLTRDNVIEVVDNQSCSVDVVAHRGYYKQPENSFQAISVAGGLDYQEIEIDLRLLGDGTWVNYHDARLGIAAIHPDESFKELSRMKFSEWKTLHLRDKATNQILPSKRPLSGAESIRIFAMYKSPGQRLNVEIKDESVKTHHLRELNDYLIAMLGQDAFYYSSSSMQLLKDLRELNGQVYLGVVQLPHKKSVDIQKAALEKAVGDDATYKNRPWWFDMYAGYKYKRTYLAKLKENDFTQSAGLNRIMNALGNNAGLHLDIRRYVEAPDVLLRARQRGLRVYTYTINADEYHMEELMRMKAMSRLPHGVIVDNTPYRVCDRLFGVSKRKQSYTATTPIGRYITSLPGNADLSRFKEGYSLDNGETYFALNGQIKSIGSSSVVDSYTKRTKGNRPDSDAKDDPLSPIPKTSIIQISIPK